MTFGQPCVGMAKAPPRSTLIVLVLTCDYDYDEDYDYEKPTVRNRDHLSHATLGCWAR